MSTCGTGTWTGPKPGDPDVNNSILSAVPAFGGIDVSWVYPGLNPQAVAHTLLYRAVTAERIGAFERVVTGDRFYDRIDNNQQYFYWIRIVSVNGTVGNFIGPASATARPLITDLIDMLSGQINNSLLAQELKTRIDKITVNQADLSAEILNRLAGENVLSLAMSDVQADAVQTLGFVSQSITTSQNRDDALANSINTVAAANAGNAAAVVTEQTARITADTALGNSIVTVRVATDANAAAIVAANTAMTTADSALATSITTAQTTLNNNIASVQTNLTTNINTVNGKVNAIGALYSVKVDVNGLVGGFGVYNDGTSIVAGFDVNNFWIGSSASRRKPFMVIGNETFIDQAVINSLTFSKLRDESGSFIVENGKVKANYLQVERISGGAYTGYSWPASGNGFYLGPEGLLLGNYNTGNYFQVAANGNISSSRLSITDGTLNLNNGKFVAYADGRVVVDNADIRRRIVAQNGSIDQPITILSNASAPGTVFEGYIRNVLSDVYDPNIQNSSSNQPYYISAIFTGPFRDHVGFSSQVLFKVQIFAQLASDRTYSNAGFYPDDYRIALDFYYRITLVSGGFHSFKLPIGSWTLYKL